MKKVNLEKNKLFQTTETTKGKGLAGKFMFSPFSVFRSFDDAWMKRKRQWLRLGIQSELGRNDSLLLSNKTGVATLDAKNGEKWEPASGKNVWQNSGTSIFDPVLCELMYAWFCPECGRILDPFAGGSVRGVVAAKMGYQYWGGELRKEQVEENIKQGKEIVPNNQPTWVCGDSQLTVPSAPRADFIFSCPPYGNMEVYSDLEEDLSNKVYEEFLVLYKNIIAKACKRLKQNRFACFVVANFRDSKTGFYYDLVGDTVRAFEECGVHYYNEGILFTSIGSLPLRTGKQFNASRKFGKAHQNILVFYKGNPKEIKTIFGEV